MFGRGILAFAKESIVLTLVSSLVVLEALADMAICLSLLAWHIELLVFKMRRGRSELHFGGLAALRWFVMRRVKYASRNDESVEVGTCSLNTICFRVQKLNGKFCEIENLSDVEGEKAKKQTAISEQATNSKDKHLYDINFSFSISSGFASSMN